jgi:hypothetical protein
MGAEVFKARKKSHGAYDYILNELRIEYGRGLKTVIRMTQTQF